MRLLLPVLCFLCVSVVTAQQSWQLRSPDGRINVNLHLSNGLHYSVQSEGYPLLENAAIDLQLTDGRALSKDARVRRTHSREVRNVLIAPVPEKRKQIPDHYNEWSLELRNGFGVEFRAYNDGVAYRLITQHKNRIRIQHERAEFRMATSAQTHFTAVVPRDNVDSFHTSFEEPYTVLPVDSVGSDQLIFSPTLVSFPNGFRMILTESDLEDYPGMFLTGSHSNKLSGKFAPYPLEEKMTEGEFPAAVVTRRADFIADTRGNRSFPWRVMLLARQDRELPVNDLVYRLGAPSRVADPSWIRPGKGTDEWIIGINLFNVPFKAGINTATYKYYIDFAKRFGFQRIMMDAGWSDNTDLFKINPAIQMDSIAAYAKSKGIGLSLWTLASTLDRQLEPALEQFEKWGVDFIMTDFMDRDDQPMVNFYHRVAEACARHHMMVMYHGAFKPAGFSRTWPNAVTREAVLGSEYNIWSAKATPAHNLLLPFIRMTAGPMDYEPGILDNATASTFRPIGEKVMSQGTRCHQAAMFVVYDSPIQLFSGNPSQGWLEPVFMELLGRVPTVWDTTLVLDAQLGEYIATARRSGDNWFIGAMNNWSPRTIDLPMTFLPDGEIELLICRDGINADRYPSDYLIERRQLKNTDTLTIDLAPGGGALLLLHQKK